MGVLCSKPHSSVAVLSSAEVNSYVVGNIMRQNDSLFQNSSVLDAFMPNFLDYLFGGKYDSICCSLSRLD